MQRQEEGFNGLFNFDFTKWTTPWGVRIAYGLGVALICLSALVHLIQILSAMAMIDQGTLVGEIGSLTFKSTSADYPRGILLFMLLVVPLAAFLGVLVLRLALEFLLGHYLLGQIEAKVDCPEAASPATHAPIEGSWTCRCGHVNGEGAETCAVCRRSPQAII